MRWIYLSPHLDDAVLSAGGLIYDQVQAGIPVEIWTIMSGYPPEGEFSQFAQLQHYMWGFPSAEAAVSARREEDRKAVEIVGARAVHFDFLDCIYRRGSNGEWLYSDIAVPPHAEDAALPGQIAEAILARIHPEDAYTREGAKLTMEWKGAGTTIGTVDGNTFTMHNEGMVLVYRK